MASMPYLIDRGIEMIKDYRRDSNAQGWARYGNNDERLLINTRGIMHRSLADFQWCEPATDSSFRNESLPDHG